MIFFRPAFVVSAVALYLAGVYFPWTVLADSATLQSFAWTIARIVPSIDGMPAEARHLPRDASRIQLSLLHFACGAFFVWLALTLKPAIWLLGPIYRFVISIVAFLIPLAASIYWIFFWSGQPSEAGLNNMHEVVGVAVFVPWFLFIGSFLCQLSAVYELARRARQGKT
jgi:hypothetical protein